MMSRPSPTSYRIFLLTVWRDDDIDRKHPVLRFSLDDPRTGQRRGFGEPEGLLAFLAACLDAGDDGNPGGPDESNS